MGNKFQRNATINFTKNETRILKKILISKKLKYEEFMMDFTHNCFPHYKIDLLCGWINDKFLLEGIDKNWNPTKYGLELEYLFDKINRRRLSDD